MNLDPEKLVVTGLVGAGPIALDREALAALPGQVADVGALVRGKSGRGVRLSSVLAHAGASPAARFLNVASRDPAFAISVALDEVSEGGVVVYEQDGAPLDPRRGGPFRLVVAGHSDECVHVKDVARLELATARGRDTRPADDAEHRALHERARDRARDPG